MLGWLGRVPLRSAAKAIFTLPSFWVAIADRDSNIEVATGWPPGWTMVSCTLRVRMISNSDELRLKMVNNRG